jgi:hypothetical protein
LEKKPIIPELENLTLDPKLIEEFILPQVLTKKYEINEEVYQKCKNSGLADPYLEAVRNNVQIKYTYPDCMYVENAGLYSGYRNVYHLLQYQQFDKDGEKRKKLLMRWDSWGTDCTFEAACDFFGLLHKTPKEEIVKLLV